MSMQEALQYATNVIRPLTSNYHRRTAPLHAPAGSTFSSQDFLSSAAPASRTRVRPSSVSSLAALGILASLSLVALGCGGDGAKTGNGAETAQTGETPNPHQNMGTPQIPPPPAGTGQGDTGMSWEKPASWTEVTPSSQMRRAQYTVPGPGGEAEMVVFYFGPGQGGDAMSNIDRWIGQFSQADGSSSKEKAQVTQETTGELPVTMVELKGIYTNRMVSPDAFPDHMLLGAVVEGPDAPWFFKMTGPEVTVRYQREAFMSLLASMKAGE